MGFYVQQARFAMQADGIPNENIVSVERTAEELVDYVNGTPDFKSLLLLGYVQSGKTNGMIMTLSKLIESGYRYFIILTGNDNDLYDQTYTRIECTNLGVHLVKKEQLNSISILDLAQDEERIIVFVVQKYGTYLESVRAIFEVADRPFIVIDDEADQASLNTNINNPQSDPSTINRHISSLLRNVLAKAYIQVTATPYALMLQDRDDIFRPKRTFILEPGNGYIGGEELFISEESRKYNRIYDIRDMVFLDDFNWPTALVESTCNFIIAATLKRLSGYSKSLSFLVHIDHTQITHENASETIRYIITRLHIAIKEYIRTRNETVLISALRKEYEDILRTYTTTITFDSVLGYLMHSLENVNNQIVNSNYKQQISYNRMYTIIIGGNKLSRGITIKNLITTYYCRNTASPNMDTVNQHARMYGYRAEIQDVMRIFTTQQIIDDFANITNADMKLRNYLSENPNTQIIPITHNSRVNATRASVVPNNELLRFTSGMTVFPHHPIYNDDEVKRHTSEIDLIINELNTEKHGQIVELSLALEVLDRIRYDSLSNEEWNREAIIALLKNMSSDIGGQIRVIIRKNSDLSRNTTRGLGAVLSSGDNEIIDKKMPILFLYKLNGHATHGWNDKAFWVPVFRMPSEGNDCVTIQCS